MSAGPIDTDLPTVCRSQGHHRFTSAPTLKVDHSTSRGAPLHHGTIPHAGELAPFSVRQL